MRLRLDSPIDLAGDDTEDEDGDLELQRPAPLPRPRSAQQQQQEKPASPSADAGRRSRKRSLERASRRESISSSDESDADSRHRRRTADSAGSGSGSGSGGTGGGFRPPTPVRILERKQKGLQFFVEPARLERMLNDVKPHSARQTDRADRQEEETSDHAAVIATRTLVCSQRFGRCEMRFRSDHVKLRVWKATDAGSEKAEWMGNVPYSQIARLCLSSGEPFMMLLEIEPAAKGYTPFAQFFDPLFAQWSQDHADTTDAQLYGAVFFFNEELDFARCRSIGDSIPGLQSFFQRAISEDEVRVFSKLDKNRGQGDREQQPRRETRWSKLTESAFSRVKLTTMWAALSHWVEQDRITLGSSNLPDRHSALASSQPDQKAHQADAKQSAKGESNGGLSQADTVVLSEETKDDAEAGPKEQHVIVLQTQDSSSSTDAVAPKTETDRRHQVVLLYPFDGADSLGRVSVTFGDITRLAPGEFLNDNIIDFYLRFLWRHSETWQKQQTYFFSSYFFSQLNASKAKLDRAPLTPQERHARVARWTQKETNLFDKRFLFIPINDSFHWSVAVFCNPGSAVVTKRRKRRSHPPDSRAPNGTEVIDLDDPFQSFRAQQNPDVANPTPGSRTLDLRPPSTEQSVEYDEVELEESRQQRTAFPPCILFLDSLRCHRKKKFSAMLREYLACEWNARYKPPPKKVHKREETLPDGTVDTPATIDDEDDNEQETFVTEFDGANIGLIEPNIPLQSNSSDCGVFLLMYAAEVVRRFPCGVTSEDVDANMASSLSPTMFDTQHVREFRDYLHQLIFCLRSLQQRGLSEMLVNEEGLGVFSIE